MMDGGCSLRSTASQLARCDKSIAPGVWLLLTQTLCSVRPTSPDTGPQSRRPPHLRRSCLNGAWCSLRVCGAPCAIACAQTRFLDFRFHDQTRCVLLTRAAVEAEAVLLARNGIPAAASPSLMRDLPYPTLPYVMRDEAAQSASAGLHDAGLLLPATSRRSPAANESLSSRVRRVRGALRRSAALASELVHTGAAGDAARTEPARGEAARDVGVNFAVGGLSRATPFEASTVNNESSKTALAATHADGRDAGPSRRQAKRSRASRAFSQHVRKWARTHQVRE